LKIEEGPRIIDLFEEMRKDMCRVLEPLFPNTSIKNMIVIQSSLKEPSLEGFVSDHEVRKTKAPFKWRKLQSIPRNR
jgi:hypothetical protein